MSDVLVIYTWMHTTVGGMTYRRYRVRGMGYTNLKFEEWCQTQNMIKAESDWPWFSWGFADPKSDEEIRLLWGAYIQDEEPYTATEPDRDEQEAAMSPAVRAINDELFSILLDEIQKEISNEMVAKIVASKTS